VYYEKFGRQALLYIARVISTPQQGDANGFRSKMKIKPARALAE
jgi:hypothetical protein